MDRRLQQHVDAWVAADLISADQAARIEEHERRWDGQGSRGGVAEAVGYVGAVLAVSSVLLFIGELWDTVAVAGRLALSGLLTVAVLGAGGALRSSPAPSVQRLVSVLWFLGVAGTGWVAWVLADDALGLRDVDRALLVAGCVALAGGTVHLLRHRALSQVAALAGTVGVALALLDRPALDLEPAWWGLTLLAVGGAWAVLGDGGWLRPRSVAETAGASLALAGTQVGAFGEARVALLGLGVVVAAALVWAAMTRDGTHLLAVGALGLFVVVPQLVFELFGDAIGAPATLLVVGLLLVVLAVGLGRVRREVGRDD